eukprot:4382408-Prorocentrum_lima.AAC.1
MCIRDRGSHPDRSMLLGLPRPKRKQPMRGNGCSARGRLPDQRGSGESGGKRGAAKDSIPVRMGHLGRNKFHSVWCQS